MELLRALGAFIERPGGDSPALAGALGLGLPTIDEHTALFTLNLYPYGSVYLGPEGMLGGEARDRVAGFWRALGAAPPDEPDHLAALLSAQASLGDMTGHGSDADRDRAAMARRALFDEHLASWLPAWLLALDDLSPAPPYRAWRRLMWDALLAVREAVGPPAVLPLHFRLAPPLADPRTGGAEAFARTLLAPAVSGIIITRATLMRAAHELNLGLRAGERRFALQALMGQAPEPVLGWLAGEASRWTTLHETGRPLHAFAADHWTARSQTTAALLQELGGEGFQGS